MSLPAIIKKLRLLNEPVPNPLRLPTEAEVDTAEQALDHSFHADYRYFLLHASDVTYGTVAPGVVTPGAGHLDLVQMAQLAWELGVPDELLPFCENNGDYYCVNQEGGVVYWTHEGDAEEAWTDLTEWIEQVWIDEEGFAEEDDEEA